MVCIVLAGGLGLRLRSIINDIPKVMAPIDGKPFLEYIINYLNRNNFKNEDIIIATGYKSDVIKNYFSDKFIYSEESSPLGTAGAIFRASFLFEEKNYIILNADTFFDIDIKDLISKHEKNFSLLTIAMAKVSDTERYARVEVDKNNKVIKIKRGLKGEGFITGGIFIINRLLLDIFPEKGPLEEMVISKIVGGPFCFGFPYDNYFIDMGIPEDYEKCKNTLPEYLCRK